MLPKVLPLIEVVSIPYRYATNTQEEIEEVYKNLVSIPYRYATN